MSDDYRDEKGRLKPGAPPLFKGKQAQQPDTPIAEPFLGDPDNSDDVIIYVSRNFGRQGLPDHGQIGYYVWLMKERAGDFNAQHTKAVARKAEAASPAGGYIANIYFTTAPQGWSVDENGKLVEPSQAKADWERKHNMVITEPPPAQPVLVAPRDDDDDEDYDEQPYTMEEVNRMSKEEFDAALAAGEIVVVDEP